MILRVDPRKGILAPPFPNEAPPSPRARLGLALCAAWLLWGTGPVSAATPTLRTLCPREWRVGDEVHTRRERRSGAEVSVIYGDPVLPSALTPEGVETQESVSVERCREVGPAASRASDVDVAFKATRDGRTLAKFDHAAFRMHVEGPSASFTPQRPDYPSFVLDWAKEHFGQRPWLDDAIPPMLRDVAITGADATGRLTRESLPPDTMFTPKDFDLDSFRGRWWIEEFTDLHVLFAFTFEVTSRHPLAMDALGGARWLTGGTCAVRGFGALRRDCRLPESSIFWELRCDGCIARGPQLLRVREFLRSSAQTSVRGDDPAATGIESKFMEDARARCVAVMAEDAGRVERLGGGILLEPDVVLSAAHLLMPVASHLSCTGSGARSGRVTEVAFPKPGSDWVLLRLDGPISDPLPKLTPLPPGDFLTQPWVPCTLVAANETGDLGLIPAWLYRSDRSAQAFFVEATNGPGTSGSPVFVPDRGLLGIVTSGNEGLGMAVGSMLTADSDLSAPTVGAWTSLAKWQSGVPAAVTDALVSAREGNTEGLEVAATEALWVKFGKDLAGAAPLAAECFSVRGRARGFRGDFDEARLDFDRASVLAPSKPWVQDALALWVAGYTLATWTVQHTAECVARSRDEAALRPSDTSALWRLARALHEAADPGWKALVRRLAGKELPSYVREQIVDWVVLSRDAELLDLWLKVTEGDPLDKGLAVWMHAARAVNAKDYGLAKKYFAAASPGEPLPLQANVLAVWLLEADRNTAAANALCSSIDLYALDAWWFPTVIYAAEASGDTDLAWRRVQVGLARFPWDKDLLEHAAQLLPKGSVIVDLRYAAILLWMARK